ncbi:class I SAM-dependent methyltransferase [Amycolatopsis minnesotensis]|uniref:Methyltransferase domain-containing protein n=1 Tax=Amycolatopsis minnesotensis TaxID=337894 RepID=A0ABN2QYD3_9PSEU
METDSTQDTSTIEKLMWEIYEYVKQRHAPVYEGGATAAEAVYLQELARRTKAGVVAEIGFNVGFSAMAFLEGLPEVKVVSFEIDRRISVDLAKEFIDARYPDRHELVLGNSLDTLPRYAEDKREQPDLVFVDGGHDYDVAYADIQNSRKIAKPGAIVVVDDMVPWRPWGVGPHEAWYEAVKRGLVEPIEYVSDGVVVDEIAEPADRAWATGRFTAL